MARRSSARVRSGRFVQDDAEQPPRIERRDRFRESPAFGVTPARTTSTTRRRAASACPMSARARAAGVSMMMRSNCDAQRVERLPHRRRAEQFGGMLRTVPAGSTVTREVLDRRQRVLERRAAGEHVRQARARRGGRTAGAARVTGDSASTMQMRPLILLRHRQREVGGGERSCLRPCRGW